MMIALFMGLVFMTIALTPAQSQSTEAPAEAAPDARSQLLDRIFNVRMIAIYYTATGSSLACDDIHNSSLLAIQQISSGWPWLPLKRFPHFFYDECV